MVYLQQTLNGLNLLCCCYQTGCLTFLLQAPEKMGVLKRQSTLPWAKVGMRSAAVFLFYFIAGPMGRADWL